MATDEAMLTFTRIFDKLFQKNPDVVILIALIPPLGNRWANEALCGDTINYAQRILAFNDAIRSTILQHPKYPHQMEWVDQYAGIIPSKHMYDDIHPNRKGEKLMATRWLNAMRKHLSKQSN